PRLVESDGDARGPRRQLSAPRPVRGLRLQEPGIEENGWIKGGRPRSVGCWSAQARGHGRNKTIRLRSESNSVRFGRIEIRPCDRFALVNHNLTVEETHDGPVLESSSGSHDFANAGQYLILRRK